jgi:N-acetylglucosamine kinase-like BadF-type ATPase
MKYILGIDGGGTKTECAAVSSTDLTVIYQCTGGPSNFLIIGIEKASENLFSLLENCRTNLNCEYEDFEIVLLGTTGAGRRSDAERLEAGFKDYLTTKKISLKNFTVESDARIALEGAFSGLPGSILIAGTGSIMFGKDKPGNIHRVGGFGRFIGDQGSGYMIGRKGLIAVSKDFDGRGEETILTGIINENFGISSHEILITEVYKNNFDIASFAPYVINAASEGDSAAVKIIEEETDELIEHITAMKEKIGEDPLHLSFIGGIISNENYYSSLLKKKMVELLLNVRIQKADHPPAMGAVFLAKELIGKI